jgi:hypothetical protein
MSGIKVYGDNGVFEYPNAAYYENDKRGVLDVLDSEDRYIATFNTGQWWHVQHMPDDGGSYDSQPRVWEQFADIPEGVVVTDRDGDYWKIENGLRRLSVETPDNWDSGSGHEDTEWLAEYAPFTEVL